MQQRGAVALGAFVGVVTFALVGALGLWMLLHVWSAYAAAAPSKAYSTAMLCARLSVAVVACVAAGMASARVSRVAPWVAGVLILLPSLYIHLVAVWRDYPVWYHVMYLMWLVPVTGLPGRGKNRYSKPPVVSV